MKFAHVVGVALLLLLGTPWRSIADPIQIQSGSVQAVGSDPIYISLVGSVRGFTFESSLAQAGARFDPAGSRPPGATVSAGGQWSTGSFGATTVTLDGRTFPEAEQRVGGMQLRDPRAYFVLDGLATSQLPTGTAGDLFTLDAPFTFSGFFNYVEDPTRSNSELMWNHNALIGHGTASLTYAGSALGEWRFRSATYQFEAAAAAAPVPEPWSVVLLGSGLVGLAARIRGRNKGTATRPR